LQITLQGDLDCVLRHISTSLVQAPSGQGRHQFESGKTRSNRLGLASLQNRTSDTPTRMTWIDEERADLGRFGAFLISSSGEKRKSVSTATVGGAHNL
jgi:hypothetical protein